MPATKPDSGLNLNFNLNDFQTADMGKYNELNQFLSGTKGAQGQSNSNAAAKNNDFDFNFGAIDYQQAAQVAKNSEFKQNKDGTIGVNVKLTEEQ